MLSVLLFVLLIWFLIGIALHFIKNNTFFEWYPKSRIAIRLEYIGSFFYKLCFKILEKIFEFVVISFFICLGWVLKTMRKAF